MGQYMPECVQIGPKRSLSLPTSLDLDGLMFNELGKDIVEGVAVETTPTEVIGDLTVFVEFPGGL
jgi:hypothetical protein